MKCLKLIVLDWFVRVVGQSALFAGERFFVRMNLVAVRSSPGRTATSPHHQQTHEICTVIQLPVKLVQILRGKYWKTRTFQEEPFTVPRKAYAKILAIVVSGQLPWSASAVYNSPRKALVEWTGRSVLHFTHLDVA